MKRIRPPLAIYIFLCAVTLVSAFGPLIYLYFHAPLGTQYRFADGFFSDYYHYLMKIESGMMGHLGYYNRYTEVPQPVSYGHALFPIMGFVSAAFGLYRPDIVYLISRIAALILLFVAMYRVVTRVFSASWYRIMAYVLFFAGTSGYTISGSGGMLRAVEPITFSGFYNALQKFPAPPHHLLASTLLLLVALVGCRPRRTRLGYVFLAVAALLIGMLQPFIEIVGVLSFWFVVVFCFLLDRRHWRDAVIPATIFTLASIVPLGYYAYLFGRVLPWTIWAHTTFGNNYQVDFLGYIVANMMFLPFLVLLIPVVKKLPRPIIFFMGWGIVVPTLLYPFAVRGSLLSLPRLLQAQQYIPLSLAASYGIWIVLRNSRKKVQKIVVGLLCVAAVVFAALPWRTTIVDSFVWKQPGYYNVFIPNDFIDALDFLERHTPSESVVLTGEYMSAVIPAFTHNRVILGRSDVVLDYDAKLQGLYAMFGAPPDPTFVKMYLDRYRIAYVLFGVDTPPYASPYTSYPFLVPVFTKGGVTVVRVVR